MINTLNLIDSFASACNTECEAGRSQYFDQHTISAPINPVQLLRTEGNVSGTRFVDVLENFLDSVFYREVDAIIRSGNNFDGSTFELIRRNVRRNYFSTTIGNPNQRIPLFILINYLNTVGFGRELVTQNPGAFGMENVDSDPSLQTPEDVRTILGVDVSPVVARDILLTLADYIQDVYANSARNALTHSVSLLLVELQQFFSPYNSYTGGIFNQGSGTFGANHHVSGRNHHTWTGNNRSRKHNRTRGRGVNWDSNGRNATRGRGGPAGRSGNFSARWISINDAHPTNRGVGNSNYCNRTTGVDVDHADYCSPHARRRVL